MNSIWVLLSKKGQGYLKWLEGLKVFGHASEATLCYILDKIIQFDVNHEFEIFYLFKYLLFMKLCFIFSCICVMFNTFRRDDDAHVIGHT